MPLCCQRNLLLGHKSTFIIFQASFMLERQYIYKALLLPFDVNQGQYDLILSFFFLFRMLLTSHLEIWECLLHTLIWKMALTAARLLTYIHLKYINGSLLNKGVLNMAINEVPLSALARSNFRLWGSCTLTHFKTVRALGSPRLLWFRHHSWWASKDSTEVKVESTSGEAGWGMHLKLSIKKLWALLRFWPIILCKFHFGFPSCTSRTASVPSCSPPPLVY